ncbi:MAG: LytR C-terminal domain-containing protein [Proteobacteria bacterium]|jgi:hypothetical protein|nr:LytR C-terminal domain-containing protein [Pseudomonadota bacterium]
MRPVICVLLGSFYSLHALACGVSEPEYEAKSLLGWTNDGRYLAYEFIRNINDEHDVWATGKFIGVVDTHEDKTMSYMVSVEGGDDGNEEQERDLAKWRSLPGKAGFDSWTSSHPLSQLNSKKTCGDATANLEIHDLSGQYLDFPELSSWSFPVEYPNRSDHILQFSIGAFGTSWAQGEAELDYCWNQWATSPTTRVNFTWSPTCKHVAWLIENYTSYDKYAVGVFEPNALIVKPAGPVIHVMAHKSAEDTVEPVVNALSKAGYAPHVGPNALKDRTETVIYSWAFAKDAAEAMAKHIPGGATVEPITWSTPADIVVATGTSALR